MVYPKHVNVSDQNGISEACYIVEIHHSAQEPAKCSVSPMVEISEDSGPEWYISSMFYSRDTPFWSGTLEMLCLL